MPHNIEVNFFELCPFSRQVRVFLSERKIPYKTMYEQNWGDSIKFSDVSVNKQLPKVNISGDQLSGWYSFLSYIESREEYSELFGIKLGEKINIKDKILFINDKFYNAVVNPLLIEKVLSYINQASPDSRNIRSSKQKCQLFLYKIEEDLKKYHWFANNDFSAADLVLASHISVLDYMNEISWQKHKTLKDWYSLVKSRPSIRVILKDRFSAFDPPEFYENPDF